MKEKKYFLISLSLMILSLSFLLLAKLYYDISEQVKTYKYSDLEEYENVKNGLELIEKMPIHFNILNKYFSDMNHLSQQEKEEIVLSFAIKNHYKTFSCGPSNELTEFICINKADLNHSTLLDLFHLNFSFQSENIDIYIDDFGTYSLSTNPLLDYYQVALNKMENHQYRTYSRFEHFKQKKETYIFYLYQGYYKGNCTAGEPLELYDFMTGKVIYQGVCNETQGFTQIEEEDISNLQLYKYELKKNEQGNFYLYGYNPVNKIEKGNAL